QRRRRIWRETVKRRALQAILFDPFGGARERNFAVVIEAVDERSVHLNAVVMQDAHAPRIVGGLRRLFMSGGEIVVGKRFKADEYAGASRERHIADEAGIVGDVNCHGRTPYF